MGSKFVAFRYKRNLFAFLCKKIIDYSIELTEINETARTRTVYYGGTIVEADGGNAANLDDGQGNKAYKITFTKREILPY